MKSVVDSSVQAAIVSVVPLSVQATRTKLLSFCVASSLGVPAASIVESAE